MVTTYDMDATYNKRYDDRYTREYFTSTILSEAEYKTISAVCKGLCPTTFNRMPRGAEAKFKYLQFIKYIFMKEREFGQKRYSIVELVKAPSERYLDDYNAMIREIRGRASASIRTDVDGPDFAKAKSARLNEGRYDDSIYDLQQRTALIGQTLAPAYEDALGIFENQMRRFHIKMECLAKQTYPAVTLNSYWDELYLRLNYARCIYWELDLLSASEAVDRMSHKVLPEGHECFAMLQDENSAYVLEDECMLLLDRDTGEIIEAEKWICPHGMYDPGVTALLFRNRETGEFIREYDADTPFDIKSYIDALGRYVESHVQEIAKKTFHVQDVTASKEGRILKRTKRVCNYLKMELQRYGRNSFVSKGKLISAFQVVFLALTDIAPAKEGPIKTKTPDGYRRERNSLSSSYSEPKEVGEKDPRYFQWICMWTEYQILWNACGTYFAQKFLELNITTLEAITAVGYQAGMMALQLHTEKVLFATMKTLVHDTDGMVELENCLYALRCRRHHIKALSNGSLCTFGKFFKLFGGKPVVRVIDRELKKRMPEYDIVLNEATDNSVLLHTPILKIRYDEAVGAYEIQRFIIKSPKYTDTAV